MMKRPSVFLACVLAVVLSAGFCMAGEFSESKRILLSKVYGNKGTTFYCGLPFTGKKVDFAGGFVPIKDNPRARRLEWEHIVPASRFGRTFPEWTQGHPDCVDSKGKPYKGRKCAEKASAGFRAMEADMHNLVPADGQVNGYRSDYPFGDIPGEDADFGGCDMEIEEGVAEPPAGVRGDIARIFFYMVRKYPDRLALADWETEQFLRWHEEDPVDRFECLRERITEREAGYANEVVKTFCDQALRDGKL